MNEQSNSLCNNNERLTDIQWLRDALPRAKQSNLMPWPASNDNFNSNNNETNHTSFRAIFFLIVTKWLTDFWWRGDALKQILNNLTVFRKQNRNRNRPSAMTKCSASWPIFLRSRRRWCSPRRRRPRWGRRTSERWQRRTSRCRSESSGRK